MAKAEYSIAFCREMTARMCAPALHFRRRPHRYESGEALRVEVEGLYPPAHGEAELELERFLGGGFAGQVYRARLTQLTLAQGDSIPGLEIGRRYAVKILIPPSRGSLRFRNAIFRLAFQGPFSAQVNHAACRAGLLWQKIFRYAAAIRFDRATAVKDAYATLYDETLGAYGEITEWVEGRTWRLESDPELHKRKPWKTVDPDGTASAEFIAKRQFMDGLVTLFHEMGAPEFARQYSWWTMKSQPNALKRTDVDEPGPGGGLCAIDFRAGLALLPFLPMSPGDIPLIFQGLFRRGALVQFDRLDVRKLRDFLRRQPGLPDDARVMMDDLETQDRAYRRSLPDLTGHGGRLFGDPTLRRSVRAGLIEGYAAADLVDAAFAARLETCPVRFALFYLLGGLPLLGRPLRRAWGHRAWRRHVAAELTSSAYRRTALRARAAAGLTAWHRAGRIGERRARFLADRPARYLMESATIGLIPSVRVHRTLTDPAWAAGRVAAFFRFLRDFLMSPDAREIWFLSEIRAGHEGGMLTEEEAEEISQRVKDPYIIKYLKCLGVHFATLPLTQIVSVMAAAGAAGWVMARGGDWERAVLVFGGVILFFQVFPLSPGSIARGSFVVYLMIRERKVRDYAIAAPLSFVKYIGYLAFPLQMTATYPKLSRFMAALWATRAVRIVPVFGERGALLEHMVFDLFYNVPQNIARWFRPRARILLSVWMGFGLGLGAWATLRRGPVAPDASLLNLWIALIALCVMPRAFFLPLLRRPDPQPPS